MFICGLDYTAQESTTAFIFTFSTESLEQKDDMFQHRSFHAIAKYNSEIFVLGGAGVHSSELKH